MADQYQCSTEWGGVHFTTWSLEELAAHRADAIASPGGADGHDLRIGHHDPEGNATGHTLMTLWLAYIRLETGTVENYYLTQRERE